MSRFPNPSNTIGYIIGITEEWNVDIVEDKMIKLFLLTRISDIFTTYLVLNKYGYNPYVEGNIVPRYLLLNYGFMGFAVTNILVSIGAYYLLQRKYNIVLKLFTIVSVLVAGYNFMVWRLI